MDEMPDIIVIAHNIRSTHNVGALFRTCEGFGVTKLILSGYTPYPTTESDERLPHLSAKITAQISKSALGAETMVPFIHVDEPPIEGLRDDGYMIVGLEQDSRSVLLADYSVPERVALLIGEEVAGISEAHRDTCDNLIEILMHGQKESFNVSVATGIALYHLTQ